MLTLNYNMSEVEIINNLIEEAKLKFSDPTPSTEIQFQNQIERFADEMILILNKMTDDELNSLNGNSIKENIELSKLMDKVYTKYLCLSYGIKKYGREFFDNVLKNKILSVPRFRKLKNFQ